MNGAVLITGASGGLGLSLVEALARKGRPVIATGRRPGADIRLQLPGVRYVQADLADEGVAPELCKGVSSVFHCAALSSPWGLASAFRLANVEITQGLLTEAAATGVDSFVYISSPSIYATMSDRLAITEKDLPAAAPLNHYAATKLEAERLVLAADGAMRTTAVRPRAIVGPDDTSILPRLIELARRRSLPLPNDGRALVEFTDVGDVVSALLLAEARIDKMHGIAVNISGGRPVSVREVATRLAEALGEELKLRSIPIGLARVLASCVEAFSSTRPGAREPQFTRYALANLSYSQTFDLSFARDILGWTPQKDGLVTLIEQARSRRCAG